MHFTREQREAWTEETRDSPFNRWLRLRTIGADGLLDLRLLADVAAEFGVDASKYAHLNAGQQRMNVGNRLRKLVPASVYSGKDSPSLPLPTQKVASVQRHLVANPRPSQWDFLGTTKVRDLLCLQSAAIDELRARGVVRTGNAPLGDYAESLFSRAFGWILSSNSAASFDAQDDKGKRFQIKARRIIGNGSRQLGALRKLPEANFDYLAAALFDGDFRVQRAALIPHVVVMARAVHVAHVNAWRFMLDDAVWNIDGVLDVTNDLASAAAHD